MKEQKVKKLVLISFIDGSSALEPCTMIAEPDRDGFVTIDREIPGPAGPTNRWHVSRVYAFDDELLQQVNRMAYPAIDLASAAGQLLAAKGRLEFPELVSAEAFGVMLESMDFGNAPKH